MPMKLQSGHDRLKTMIRIIVVALALISLTSEAHAMNWEGHDDWMIELPAAKQFQAARGKAVKPSPPARRENCMPPEKLGQAQPNPYDNVLPLCNERRRPAK
jgi:hypothetical protein